MKSAALSNLSFDSSGKWRCYVKTIQKLAWLQSRLAPPSSFFRFNPVSRNLSIFNDWNAVVGFCHRSRGIHFDFLDSALTDGYDYPKVAQACRTPAPDFLC